VRKKEKKSTHIFDQEHCLPADLRSQVLHRQFASVTNTGGGQNGIVVKCLRFALERELLPFDIELLKHVAYVRRKTRVRPSWIAPGEASLPERP
jgi:hypothetical protein